MSTFFNNVRTLAAADVGSTLSVSGATTLTGDLTVTTGATTLQDAVVMGDLTVMGNTTSLESQQVSIKDRHLVLNKDYVGSLGLSGGLAVVVGAAPVAVFSTSATGGFATATTVNMAPTPSPFSPGDFIQVTGAANAANNSVYQVASHTIAPGNVLTIEDTGQQDFVNTVFEVDATDTAAVFTKVIMSIMQTDGAGAWQSASADNAGSITFISIGGSAHSGLTGLGDDDHDQYVLRAGRTGVGHVGGQTLFGSTATTESLTLVPNSADTTGALVLQGVTTVTSTVASTSTVTGALQVAGGAGIAENLFVGGVLNVDSVDRATAGAISIGGTNATSVDIAANAAATAVNVGTGGSVASVSIGVADVTTTSVAGDVVFAGAFSTTIATISDDTILAADATLKSGYAMTGANKTLPLPPTPANGTVVRVFNASVSANSIAISAGDTFFGSSTAPISLAAQHDHISLMYSTAGSTWYAI